MNDIMYVIRSLLEVRAFLSIRVARSSSCFCALAFYWIAPTLPLSSLRYELAFLLLMGRQTFDPDVGGLFGKSITLIYFLGYLAEDKVLTFYR